ncbi:hypothetical protein HDV05_001468 [Chytridiales sp. JEL 0842]|nr:hypothetical protein HDV05_001468 [Chytridiales sp. JEL 0842]
MLGQESQHQTPLQAVRQTQSPSPMYSQPGLIEESALGIDSIQTLQRAGGDIQQHSLKSEINSMDLLVSAASAITTVSNTSMTTTTTTTSSISSQFQSSYAGNIFESQSSTASAMHLNGAHADSTETAPGSHLYVQESPKAVHRTSPPLSKKQVKPLIPAMFDRPRDLSPSMAVHETSIPTIATTTAQYTDVRPISPQWSLPRLIMDQSVLSSLMNHLSSDSTFEVIGYLGGVTIQLHELHSNGTQQGYSGIDYTICHVTHFVPCQRTFGNFIANEAQETCDSYQQAIDYFNAKKVSCIGWYKSVSPMVQPLPNKLDIQRQSNLQRLHPGCVGVLLSVTSSNRPSRFFPEVADPTIGAPIVAPINAITAFKTSYEQTSIGWSVVPEEVVAAVLEQSFVEPDNLRSSYQLLIKSLNESIDIHKFALDELNSDDSSRSLINMELERFLRSLWHSGILEASKAADSEYSQVSTSAAAVKEWINGKLEALQNTYMKKCQKSMLTPSEERCNLALENIIRESLSKSHNPSITAVAHLSRSLSNATSTLSHSTPVPSAYSNIRKIIQNDPLDPSDTFEPPKKIRKTRKDKGEKRKRKGPPELLSSVEEGSPPVQEFEDGVEEGDVYSPN